MLENKDDLNATKVEFAAPSGVFDLRKMEAEIAKQWEEKNIRKKVLASRKGKKPYYFMDGPPYATGYIHMGTGLNKTLKDYYMRFWRMSGFDVNSQPGYDTHGVPIENKVEKKLGLNQKSDIEKFGVEKFNVECRKFATEFIEIMNQQFNDLGVWMDWENPYLTLQNSYIEGAWHTFKIAYEKGLLYKGVYPVHICSHCATAVAYSEIEYQKATDPAVFVKFKANNLPNTYFIIWTTTPWTLPSNTGIMVHPKFEYAKVNVGDDTLIIAKDLVKTVMSKAGIKHYEIAGTVLGKELKGHEYTHPLKDILPLQKDITGKVVLSEMFVTLTDGTGMVHTAPGHGKEDYKVGTENNLLKLCPVNLDGTFDNTAGKFAGMYVKQADAEIIKELKARGAIFASEKVTHDYPHCWRCKTPLLQVTVPQWFFAVSEIRDTLIKENKKVNWVPDWAQNRFGGWLENLGDWPISRQRYWGIPLPIWVCDKCSEVKVAGSIEDMARNSSQKITRLIFVRHGESEKNVLNINSSAVDKFPLTTKGREEAEQLGNLLCDEKIDIVVSSPVLRSKQTAEILQNKLNVNLIFDDLITEYNHGEWENRKLEDLSRDESHKRYAQLKSNEEKFNHKLGVSGESRADIIKRVKKFVDNVIKENKGKTILVVSHAGINGAIEKVISNISIDEFFIKEEIKAGTVEKFYITERGVALDLHRPYVDEITFKCKCGGTQKRIPDVLDVWFDSGVSSWASLGYPKNKERFSKMWPAELNIEGPDQIRGWWNSQLICSVITFGKKPFNNIIMHGMVLDNKGNKMSKSLGNVIAPSDVVAKHSRDILRVYLLSGTPETDFYFDWEGVKSTQKFLNILFNSVNFMKSYAPNGFKAAALKPRAPASGFKPPEKIDAKKQKLQTIDNWMISRVNSLITECDRHNRNYQGYKAVSEIHDFVVNDFSRTYIKLTRERTSPNYEGADKETAFAVMDYVLKKVIVLLAPAAPFSTEKIYQMLGGEEESVHLLDFSSADKKLVDTQLEADMKTALDVVEAINATRQENNLRLRWPLKKATVSGEKTVVSAMKRFGDVVKELANVKDIAIGDVSLEVEVKPNYKVFGPAFGKDAKVVADLLAKADARKVKEETKKGKIKLEKYELTPDMLIIREKVTENLVGKTFVGGAVYLDTERDEEIIQESLVRELVRHVQVARKEAGLDVKEKITLYLKGDEKLLSKWKSEIEKSTTSNVVVGSGGKKRPVFEFEAGKVEVGF